MSPIICSPSVRKQTKTIRKQNSFGKIGSALKLENDTKHAEATAESTSTYDCKLPVKESITTPGITSTPNSLKKQRKYKNSGLKRSQSIGHSIGSDRHEFRMSPLNSTRRVRCSHSRSNENLWLVGSYSVDNLETF